MNVTTKAYPATSRRSKEASSYASMAKIHLVYSWLLTHGLNLNEYHKAQFINELTKRNVQFLKLREEAELRGKDVAELRQFDEVTELEELENVSLVRSMPGRYGIKIIEYALHDAFLGDLRGIPGCYLKESIFRLNFPDWKHGLVKPYYNDSKIIGLYLYQSITDGLPKLFSSHNLLLGKKFIEPRELHRGLFIY